jgi:hypothetical protein
LPEGEIDVNLVLTKIYGDFKGYKAAKKQSQTKPIYSYCVPRAAYCENEFEKTKPICAGPKWRIFLFERSL